MDIKEKALDKILIEAKKDAIECGKNCQKFSVLSTPYDLSKYFVKYIRVDASNPERIDQSVKWICFDYQGDRLDCDPIFQSVSDENAYKRSMVTLFYSPDLIDIEI